MTSIVDDMPPHVQAKIAAAVYLAAMDDRTPKRCGLAICFLDLFIGYTTMLMIGAAWIFLTHRTYQWHALPSIGLLMVPATACAYALCEFVWLLMVSLLSGLVRSLLGKLKKQPKRSNASKQKRRPDR